MNKDSDRQELLDLAYPYAIDAVPASEEPDIDTRLEVAEPDVRRAFDQTVREIHEAMALVANSGAVAPTPELRDRVLAALDDIPQDPPAPSQFPRRRRRWFFLAAAAALITTVAAALGLAAPHAPEAPTVNATSH